MSTLQRHPAATHYTPRCLRALLLFCLLSTIQPFTHSAFASHLITPITGIRGLEGANVRMSLQTRDGYLWLATSVGLVRYDGLDSITYRPANTPALNTTDVRSLYQARNGDLWIGTAQGVVRRHNDTFERILTLENTSTRAFAEDATGAIWIGTFGQGLYSWHDGALRHHPRQKHLAPNAEYIHALHVDHAGALWIGTNAAGLIRLENAANPGPDPAFQRLHATGPTDRIIGGEIETIAEHPRGTYWFGSHSRGLFRLTPDGAISRYTARHGLTTLQVNQITPAADGGLWVTSGALHKLAPAQLNAPLTPDTRLTPIASIPDERIIAYTEDHEGNLWLCARIAGLLRARAAQHTLINTANGLPGDSVKTISRDPRGNLWLAIRRGGIVKLAPDGDITRLPIPPGMEDATPRNDPEVALAATDGTIWSIWQRQVYHWRDNHYTPIGNRRDAFGLHEDRQGNIWVSRSSGTERYKNGQLLDTPADAPLRSIRRGIAFHEAPDGAVYIASWAYGLYKYDPATNTLTTHDTTNGLPGDNARAVYIDTRGNLWVGIRDHGLVTLDPDGRWRHSDALSAALADQVSAIAEDDRGNLWLGTTAGVMWAPIDNLLHSARTGEPVHDLHSLAITDNHQPSPVWVGAAPVHNWTPDGRLLFATRAGIISFDPRHATPLATPPPIHIENAIADGHPLDMRARPVAVPAGTRTLTIEYAGLSYIRPDRMAFKYRLDNKADWQDAGPGRRVTFSALAPGHYQFQVTARNADGAWNPDPDTLHFTVAPFFYQTLWFRIALPAALLAALALAILSTYKTRTRRLQRRAADLARQNTELETRIQQRTLELTLSNTAKSEFLENISHEIRNPLNGITGLIDQLDDDPDAPLTPAQRDRNRALTASARQLNRVFEEILGFSKLEYGCITTHETRFSPHALLAEIRDTFSPQAAAARNTITLRLPPDEHHYTGDEAKIRTIIDNFVTNALKYAPGTPITITLTTTGTEECGMRSAERGMTDASGKTHTAETPAIPHSEIRIPHSQILIEVADHGPGVSRDEQELIFKKFARGAAARRAGISGTGIGLATCAATAQHLGGSVGIESQPGQGATFFLKIPLRRAPAAPPAAATTPQPPPENPESTNEKPHPAALIVEDQHYNQIVLAGLLRRNGIPADCATTAAEALDKIAARPYELIFLDIELPDMKGTDLARRIRSRPGGDRPIIIGASAHDSDEIRARCLESGMNEFLLKPLRENPLIAAVARLREFSIETTTTTPNSETTPQRPIENPVIAQSDTPPNPNLDSKLENHPDLSALELYAAHVPGGMPAAKRAFIDTLSAELANLRAAHETGDSPAIAQAAHRVRSHTTLVGAPLLCETAGAIERHARRGENGPRITTLLAEIESHAATLIEQLA